jgi:hypothetical protein
MRARSLPAAVLAADDPLAENVARVVPPDAKMVTFGNVVIGYENDPHKDATPQDHEAGGWTRISALGTRKRLRALRRLRLDDGAYLGSVAGWAEAIAMIAVAIDGEISAATLAKHLRYVGIEVDDRILYPVARKAAAAHAARALEMNPRIMGELLQLTVVERDELRIRSIDSCEETAAEREKRLDRERSNKLRRERGAEPRSASISATQPWVRDGYATRRTWERHGKVPRMSQTRHAAITEFYGSKGSVTNLRQSHVERDELATFREPRSYRVGSQVFTREQFDFLQRLAPSPPGMAVPIFDDDDGGEK